MPIYNPRSTKPIRICPSCGTRMAHAASHCAVCGMVFEKNTDYADEKPLPSQSGSSGKSFPIGLYIGGPIILLLAVALLVVFLFRTGAIPVNQMTLIDRTLLAATPTLTSAATKAPTNTPTMFPSPSPVQPIMITVKEGDTCYGLAAKYGLRDFSMMTDVNGQAVDCDNLQPGEIIYILPPTPASPLESATDQNSLHQTETACPIAVYTVDYGDTLGGIAASYRVPMESIKKWNPEYSFIDDVVWEGMVLRIPLCEQTQS
jgi:LysM repeat protein